MASRGAVIEDGMVQHFGDFHAEVTAASREDIVCDLGQYATLRVSGEDAQSFLQNLLSNDIKEVSPSRSQHSSFNTAKGRMLASFLIWMEGSDYLLMLPSALSEMLRKKLSMYVLRAKVKIQQDENILLGISGPAIKPPLDCGERMGVAREGSTTVIRLDDARFLLHTAPDQAGALWDAFASHAKPAGSACWDWLNVRAGIPVIVAKTQEEFVPQMVNLDLIGGISFKKGCYPGQEIVARMHYLGKLKRRMYLAHVDGYAEPGDHLYSEDMAGQSNGIIANAAPSPAGGCDVLAVVQISSHDGHPIHLGSIEGKTLRFEPLPYALPAA